MKRQNGFSLIELILVVAMALILAVLATPYLISVRRSANESSAVAALRAISSSELAYASRNGQAFSGSLSTLVTGGYLDQRFSNPASVNGYAFGEGNTVGAGIPNSVPTSPPGGFSYSARPADSFIGLYNYAVASDNVIYYGNSAPQGLSGAPVR